MCLSISEGRDGGWRTAMGSTDSSYVYLPLYSVEGRLFGYVVK